MDRIKLAYLRLKEKLRVNNFKKIGCTVFAIHDNFERYGIVSNELSYKKLNP